jgi:hypothetical protein
VKARALHIGLFVIVAVSPAGAQDGERIAMTQVHLTTEAHLVAGCTRIGSVSDDSVKDLRRKIVRAGGNTGVLSFRSDDLSMIYAEVFRCGARGGRSPNIPPPPPGPPPPPPSR